MLGIGAYLFKKTSGDVGTITLTIKNTATKATQTVTVTHTSGGTTTTTTTTTDINADIESVYLYGKEIEVISRHYRHVGELGLVQISVALSGLSWVGERLRH